MLGQSFTRCHPGGCPDNRTADRHSWRNPRRRHRRCTVRVRRRPGRTQFAKVSSNHSRACFTSSVSRCAMASDTTSPAIPQPWQLNACFARLIEADAVLSSWNGHRHRDQFDVPPETTVPRCASTSAISIRSFRSAMVLGLGSPLRLRFRLERSLQPSHNPAYPCLLASFALDGNAAVAHSYSCDRYEVVSRESH